MTTKHMSQADELARGWFQARPSVRQSILVVEDAGDLRQLNAEVLIDAGYHVDVTDDMATAWTALQLYRYDLVVTDQFLPETLVVNLIAKIYTAQMALPVIMVTDILPAWELALHPGLESVKNLRKPYTIEKLLGMVKNALSESAVVRGKFAPLTNSQGQPAGTSLRPC